MNTELEKVTGIKVDSKLFGSSESSGKPNLFIIVGALGLIAEAVRQEYNPLLTVLLFAVIAAGATFDILESIKPGKEIKHLT